MFSNHSMKPSTGGSWAPAEELKDILSRTETVVIGAGAGLSASAGLTYAGERFQKHFADFIAAYHLTDMYTAGFYPYDSAEEYWAYWSRHICVNRYDPSPGKPYRDLLDLVKDKDYFVLTTNVDHQFQLAGFDKQRLFYTQGDYGLWQCSRPCHLKTYDNEAAVRRMVAEQRDRRIPTELLPRCPVCGAPMAMNLRCDHRFVEDAGWHAACGRYESFLRRHDRGPVLYLELGVGGNTPGIIKYPFWQLTAANPQAIYACINLDEAVCPPEIRKRSLGIAGDIGQVLEILKVKAG